MNQHFLPEPAHRRVLPSLPPRSLSSIQDSAPALSSPARAPFPCLPPTDRKRADQPCQLPPRPHKQLVNLPRSSSPLARMPPTDTRGTAQNKRHNSHTMEPPPIPSRSKPALAKGYTPNRNKPERSSRRDSSHNRDGHPSNNRGKPPTGIRRGSSTFASNSCCPRG